MDDWAFLFGWAAYNCVTLSTSATWLVHGTRAGAVHDSRGRRPSARAISWVYALSFGPWIWAWWWFARSVTPLDNPAYQVALALVAAGLTFEKLWLLFHMQWQRYGIAMVWGALAALCYAGASAASGYAGGVRLLDSSPGGVWQWEHVPATVLGALAALWMAFLAAAELL